MGGFRCRCPGGGAGGYGTSLSEAGHCAPVSTRHLDWIWLGAAAKHRLAACSGTDSAGGAGDSGGDSGESDSGHSGQDTNGIDTDCANSLLGFT